MILKYNHLINNKTYDKSKSYLKAYSSRRTSYLWRFEWKKDLYYNSKKFSNILQGVLQNSDNFKKFLEVFAKGSTPMKLFYIIKKNTAKKILRIAIIKVKTRKKKGKKVQFKKNSII